MHHHRSDASFHSTPGGIVVMKPGGWKSYLALVVLALIGMTLSVAPAQAEPKCFNVSGTLAPFSGSGFPVTGDLAGILVVDFFELQSGENGALHAIARQHWVTADGELDDVDEIVLAPVGPPVYHENHRMTIVGGTGIFAGATGSIHVQGFANFATGEVDLVYHGHVCLQ
jgi:hypothetical protein